MFFVCFYRFSCLFLCVLHFVSFPVMVLKQTGKRFLRAFRACFEKWKREISHYTLSCFAVAFSHFRGLAAAMLTGTHKINMQALFLWYALNLSTYTQTLFGSVIYRQTTQPWNIACHYALVKVHSRSCPAFGRLVSVLVSYLCCDYNIAHVVPHYNWQNRQMWNHILVQYGTTSVIFNNSSVN